MQDAGGRSLRSLLSLDTSLENLSFWIAIVRGNSTLECKLKQVSEMFCVFLHMINQCLWASGLLREWGRGREICFLTPRKRIVKNITWQTVDFAAPVSNQMPGFEWDHLQALGGMAPRRITSGATRGKASAARFGSLVDACIPGSPLLWLHTSASLRHPVLENVLVHNDSTVQHQVQYLWPLSYETTAGREVPTFL